MDPILNSSDYIFVTNDSFLSPSNITTLPLTFTLPFTAAVHVLYNGIFVSSVIGNLLVIYVVSSSKRMQTVANFLLANLALGDLLMALLCVPFSYISVLVQHWPFGRILCHVVSPAQAVCVFVSSYTLIALAVDRYMAILYPLRPRMGKKQVTTVIGCIWSVASLTALPVGVFTRLETIEGLEMCDEFGWTNGDLRLAYSLTLMILQYFFPIIVLIFTYTRISYVIWGKGEDNKRMLGTNEILIRGMSGNGGLLREQRLARAKKKMIKMMILICSIYTFCWFPFNILMILLTTVSSSALESSISEQTLVYIYFITHFLAISHTVVNPIIYCGMNARFRQGFGQTIGRLLPRRFSRFIMENNSNFYSENNVTTVVMSSRSRITANSGIRNTNKRKSEDESFI